MSGPTTPDISPPQKKKHDHMSSYKMEGLTTKDTNTILFNFIDLKKFKSMKNKK